MKRRARINFEHNSRVDPEQASLRPAFDPEGYIVGQDTLEEHYCYGSAQTHLQRTGKRLSNSCGPIAVCNVLQRLGEKVSLPQVFRDCERAALLRGDWGTLPWGLGRCLKRRGYRVRYVYRRAKYDEALRQADAGILMFLRKEWPPTGHNIMVYCGADGRPNAKNAFSYGGAHVLDFADTKVLWSVLILVKKRDA